MIPTSFNQLMDKALGLVVQAFNSIGGMFVVLFDTFIKLSPLPDEIDFFIFFGIIIWVIVMIWRLISGKK